MDIVTESGHTLETEQLHINAIKVILSALEVYEPEPWEEGLVENITETLNKNLKEK